MTKSECALNTIQKERQIDHGGFDLLVQEVNAVYDANSGDAIGVGFDLFLLGFARGRKCEQKLQKEKKRGTAV